MDIRTQLQLAILSDFYGPAERLQRLAGLSIAEIVERIRELELDPASQNSCSRRIGERERCCSLPLSGLVNRRLMKH